MAETNDRVVALTAAVTEYNQDVTASLAALRADVDRLNGEVAAGRDATLELNAVNESLGALEGVVGSGVTAVGDADGDGVPAAPLPEPTPEEPPAEVPPVEEVPPTEG